MSDSQKQAEWPGTKIVQLTRNAGGHYANETFTREQAEATGIDAKLFRAFPDEKRTRREAKAGGAAKR